MAEITLLLGANRGEPHATFARATTLIEDRIGRILASSRDHWTEPWGFQDDRLFLNRAILLESDLAPARVMEKLLEIEKELGRERTSSDGYASRTIDLDILFIGEQVIEQPGLSVPHPRVHERTFALAPAADIIPDLVHPVLKRMVIDLLDQTLHEP
ncbi:MAG: 2-amino-4-hydroxy-6-hydroxymethyldihydropteridine diphosphokinase [Flavobacteriales bacterium]